MELDFGNNNKLSYYYDGSGKKLTKINTPGAYYPTTTEYRGLMVHQATSSPSSLKYIITPEGRLINTGTNAAPVWGWEYDLKDHLGNVRVIFKPNTDNTGVVRVEYANYFPFGMKMLAPYSTFASAKYLYNGKEYQDDFGLNWYDYGARFYDATLGRWHSVDPSSESYYPFSPYAYCGNNPIRLGDLDGRDWFDKVVGFTAAIVDNATGIDRRGSFSPTDAADYNMGQDMGDVASVLMGAGEVDAGAGMAASSAAVTLGSGGLSLEVTGPTLVTGTAMAAHGTFMIGQGISNFASQKGRVSEGNKEVNGNSKSSTKEQHNYDIKDTQTGKVVKTGTSGGKETKAGESYRGNSQANKWNKQEGTPGRYKSETTNRVPAGSGARQKALDYEKNRANQVRPQLDPNKHKIP